MVIDETAEPGLEGVDEADDIDLGDAASNMGASGLIHADGGL